MPHTIGHTVGLNVHDATRDNFILQKNDINDIWRTLNPNTKHYTCHSNTKPTIFCRLENLLVSNILVNKITKSNTTNKHHKTKLPNCPQDKRRLVAGLKELVSVKQRIALALRGDTMKLLW